MRRQSTRAERFLEPAPDGLPNRRVVLVPLLLLLLLFIGLVGAGYSGTSSGEFHKAVGEGSDSRLILGNSRDIRSDEWFVQTPWTVSQVEQGLPRINKNFPGGMDATVQHDMPSKDWSTAFRPHLWGFFVLPLDHAMAFKWWMPIFSMIGAGYLLMVSLLPRRPIGAMAMSGAFFFAPFFQWWSLSITYWPVAWALLTMAAVVWLLRRPRSRYSWLLAALSGYLIVPTGTGVYVPFIVPVVFVVAAFAVGATLHGLGADASTVKARIRRLLPLFLSSGAAVVVMGLWAATRWSTIELFTSTVYPGARLSPPGAAANWYDIRSIFGAVMSKDWLNDSAVTLLGPNRSEASSFFVPGLFLVPLLVWLLVRRWRSSRDIDWLALSVLLVVPLFLAYLFLPGWDSVSHLLFLDRTTAPRMRLGLGLISVVIVLVIAWRLDQLRRSGQRAPWWIVVSCGALAVASNLWLIEYLGAGGRGYDPSPGVIAVAVAYVLVVVLIARGMFTSGALVFLAMSMLSAAWVNPIYRGVFDLNDTKAVQAAKRIDSEDPGAWVGIGLISGVSLVESGLTSFNGFQSAPPALMWKQIDPTGQYEQNWNRLGLVSWGRGSGEPVPTNPTQDQVRMEFDSCSSFAQQHVSYVLSEGPTDQPCLQELKTITEGGTAFSIYEVTGS